MDIILITGLWLDASAWDPVAGRLTQRGHRPRAVALPGQGAPPRQATLDDQLDAVVGALDRLGEPALIVGHSAASTLAWMAADARPQRVARVVTIGGFPSGDGEIYNDFFALDGDVLPFPGWDAFEEAVVADLDATVRDAIERSAIPVARGVVGGTVRLRDARRFDVPVTVICPEFSAAQAREWIADGDVPELSSARRVDYVDIDSGHWPMFTRPDELADLIAGLAGG